MSRSMCLTCHVSLLVLDVVVFWPEFSCLSFSSFLLIHERMTEMSSKVVEIH